MGKGDRKTAKGKRNISSYGNARPNAAVSKVVVAKSASTAAKPKAAAPARKTVTKKTAAR